MLSPLNNSKPSPPAVLCLYAILGSGIKGCAHVKTRSSQNSISQSSQLHRLAALHAVPINIINVAVLYFVAMFVSVNLQKFKKNHTQRFGYFYALSSYQISHALLE
jgi:hypothetical protein